MGLFGSSGKHYKHKAEYYANKATDISNYQNEVEFRRQLLSNIRQERIARAQLEAYNYNPTAATSSQQGAIANIDSALAGEADFSYGSSIRQQQMTDYTNLAQKYYKKYQKAQKRRAATFGTIGTVVGAVLGAISGGALAGVGTAIGSAAGSAASSAAGSYLGGAIVGAQIGQGIGQIASGTGQTEQGIKNVIGGFSTGYGMYTSEQRYQELISALNDNNSVTASSTNPYGRYVAASVINGSPSYGTAETYLLPQLNGTTVKAVKGCY